MIQEQATLVKGHPKPSRPISIVITLVLMLLSTVPLALGLLFVFLRTLASEPSALLSLRSLLFIAVAFAVIIVLLYGVVAIWKQKKFGYWIALLFLLTLNLKDIYVFGPTVYKLLLTGQPQTVFLLDQTSRGVAILDLAVQSVMFLLLLLLLLKVAFGKRERTFFFPPGI